jgi:PAS domain S-box-containing protein
MVLPAELRVVQLLPASSEERCDVPVIAGGNRKDLQPHRASRRSAPSIRLTVVRPSRAEPNDVTDLPAAREGLTGAEAAAEKAAGDTSLFSEVLLKKLRERIFAVKNLREREKTYRLIVENTTDAVVETDQTGTIRSINPSFTAVFGHAAGELVGSGMNAILTRKSTLVFRRNLQAHLCLPPREGEREPTRIPSLVGRRADGTSLQLDMLIVSFEKDKQSTIVLIMRDVTEQAAMAEELQASKDSYWALSETTTDAILQISESFQIIFANTAIEQIFGHTRADLLRKSFSCLFPAPVYQRYLETFRKYFLIDETHRKATNLRNTLEILGTRSDGGIVPLEISFGNSKSVRGQRTLTCIVRDITQRKQTERRLRFLAYHDKLTTLGNRDLFGVSLHDFLANAARSPDICGALLFLDLDGFKKVNDTLGHEAGDAILLESARRLSNFLRESDQVYRMSGESMVPDGAFMEELFRFGGDEFVILLTNLRRSTDAAIVAQKIIDSIRRPFDVSSFGSIGKISLGVSVGIALIPKDGLDAKSLISSADVAMYRAKELGNRFRFFAREMNEEATTRLLMENEIRIALEQGGVRVHYQPLVDATGTIMGLEALARLSRPKEGLINPAEFIPTAEESGLIVPLGDRVLEIACRDLKTWNDSGYPHLYVSVNFSARQFRQDDFVDKITSTIRRTGVDSANVKVEVTESVIMTDPDVTAAKLEALRERNPGIRFAVDDFGTGYSSLSCLTNFPIDVLKIDRSFVEGFPKKRQSRIIDAIITLAHSLKMETIAEGIETREQLAYLVSRKCSYFQGFFFSKPVEASRVPSLLSTLSDVPPAADREKYTIPRPSMEPTLPRRGDVR